MKTVKEKVTFCLSGIIYFLVNLRIASTFQESVIATLGQFVQTAPFLIGVTWVIVAFFHYMANGKKMPWDRRIRIFFALGIMTGLFLALYEYADVTPAGG